MPPRTLVTESGYELGTRQTTGPRTRTTSARLTAPQVSRSGEKPLGCAQRPVLDNPRFARAGDVRSRVYPIEPR
jgi:hypothetical protein